MNILFLSTGYYPHVGGKSTHIESLRRGFEELGHTTDIISLNDVEKELGFKVRHFLSRPSKLISKNHYFVHTYKIISDTLKSIIQKKLKTNHFDAICSQDPHSTIACGKIKNDIPIMMTMHTYFGLEYLLSGEMNENSQSYKKELDYVENSLSYVQSVMCVDSRINEHIKSVARRRGYNNIVIDTIKNFTNTDVFNCQQNPKLRQQLGIEDECFVGVCARRMVEKNGVLFAVKSLACVNDDIPVKLIVCGDGVEKDRICKEIETDHLEGKVILCGAVNNDQLVDYYHASDFAIVPSITVNGLQEATSITAIESMSCGLPTIASNIGGLKEMISNGKNGILVNEQDPNAIARAIEELYENKDLRESIGQMARRNVIEEYSYISAANDYLKAITGMINK